MNFTRRDLTALLPVLALVKADAESAGLPSKTYAFENLKARPTGPNNTRPVLKGETHTGFPIELHETELAPGQAPHPPHHHIHEEMIMIREGMMVEVTHGPLKGVIGRLTRKGAHARLVLSVDLIGQAVSVEVDAADVRAY